MAIINLPEIKDELKRIGIKVVKFPPDEDKWKVADIMFTHFTIFKRTNDWFCHRWGWDFDILESDCKDKLYVGFVIDDPAWCRDTHEAIYEIGKTTGIIINEWMGAGRNNPRNDIYIPLNNLGQLLELIKEYHKVVNLKDIKDKEKEAKKVNCFKEIKNQIKT